MEAGMRARRLGEGVFWVGAADVERREFDELVALPEGTTYNAYVVKGALKTALVDTVDPAFTHVLLARLQDAGVESLDYVVCNHAEQDHSGALPEVLRRYPAARVLCTSKAKSMLRDLLDVAGDRVDVVEDGSRVDLGGKTLRFVHFPWVHWPETMLTLVEEEGMLLSCDLFGSHLAVADVDRADPAVQLLAARRYYATIMMPLRAFIEKGLPKVTALQPRVVAPSHGPVWRDPSVILDAHARWVGGKPANLVALAYVSMHDSTRRMVTHLADALVARGVAVEVHHLGDPDVGRLAMSLIDAATLVVGSPVFLVGPHPRAGQAASLVNLLKPKLRHVGLVGSFGWGGKVAEQLMALLSGLKVEALEPVLCKGVPRDADLAALDGLAATIAGKHALL
jgi:flavorubredoxin